MKAENSQPDKEIKSEFHDLLFFISSIIFNLAISGLYLAVTFDKQSILKLCGLTVVLLIIPYSVTLISFVKSKSKKSKIIMNLIILFYLFIELGFDYIFKIPFRDIPAIHIPYIVVFYAAAYSMMLIVWRADRKRGVVVFLTFILLIICLIYMFSK